MLDLAPEIENSVRDYAAREGVSLDVFARRLLSTYLKTAPQRQSEWETEAANVFAAGGNSEAINGYGELLAEQEVGRAAVLAYINAPEAEIARRHAPSIARLQARIDAAAHATPEEIAAADAEWEAHKESMNENRRITGERLLYSETEAQP